jgi:hypothetical protein
MVKKVLCLICLELAVGFSSIPGQTQSKAQVIEVPMTAERWSAVPASGNEPKPDVQFLRQEGLPNGLLVLKSASMRLAGESFRNGTIEFDMKGIGEDIPGIEFRQEGPPGKQDAEEFYIRISPDCRASDDCIQYAPVIHGFMLWNSYPQYQTQAFILDGWNHIKLVVSGERMNVYVNGLPKPALVVGCLESESKQGGIALRGPAVYANLTIAPDDVEGLAPQPTSDPTAKDRGFVREWRFSPVTPRSADASLQYSDMPNASAGWQSVTAERFGMVNLNRRFQLDLSKPAGLMWLRTTIVSDQIQIKHVALGWLGTVWVFLNGKLVTQGKNIYYPPSERRDPDGRLDLRNGSFDISLAKGKNEVAVALVAGIHDDAVSPNRYGWGLMMRFENPSGLVLSKNAN